MNNVTSNVGITTQKYVGRTCIGITLCGMRLCGEQFVPPGDLGYHGLTWGIIIYFEGCNPLVLTWGEDFSIGDPFFIDVVEEKIILRIDTLELQDVSSLVPWNSYVGCSLKMFYVYSYDSLTVVHDLSNGNITKAQRSVPWGVELHFEGVSLLVGALRHETFTTDEITSDEVIVAYNASVIGQTKDLRRQFKSQWDFYE